MSEKFSWLKFFNFGGFVWLKALKFGLCLGFLGLIGLTVYRAFFMPTQSNTQRTIFPGSVEKVEIHQEGAGGKLGGPFVEVYGEAKGFNLDEWGVGLRIGLHY